MVFILKIILFASGRVKSDDGMSDRAERRMGLKSVGKRAEKPPDAGMESKFPKKEILLLTLY